jgi:hypothetical protein
MSAQPYAGLRPCPFCGSTEVSMSYSATMTSPEPANRFVECEECAGCGPTHEIVNGNDFVAKNLAARAWNTRPEAAEAISSLLNALRAIEGDEYLLGPECRAIARAALNSDASTQTVGGE